MAGSTIYLATGDGATSDSLQLNDGTNYALRWNPFDLGNSAATGGGGSSRSQRNRLRTVSLPLTILGTDSDDLWSNVDAVLEKLDQTRHAIERGGYRDRVTLSVKLGGTTWVYWDLLLDDDGEPGLLVLPDNAHMQAAFLKRLECTLTLNVRGVGRGDKTYVAGTASITNGTSSVYDLGTVPGHYPALCRLSIADLSDNSVVINRITVGQRRAPGLTSGDFAPVLALDGTGTADTSALGGQYWRVAATSAWQTVGSVTKPADAPLTQGELDVWAMVRDSTTVIGTPTGLSALAGGATKIQSTFGFNAADTASLTMYWPQPPTPGSLLLLTISRDTQAPTTPDGWTLAFSTAKNNHLLRHYYKLATASEPDSLTVGGASIEGMAAEMCEYMGFDGITSPLDRTSTNTNGVLGSSSASTGSTGTTAQANELAFAAVHADSVTVSSWSNSFTEHQDISGTNAELTTAERVLTATGSYSTTATLSASTQWAAGIATYTANAAVGTLPADSYTVRVAAVTSGGQVGIASNLALVTLPVAGSIPLDWDAPSTGASPSQYRVYYKRATVGTWKYFATGSTATSYTLTTETGATTGDPNTGTSLFGQFRLRYGLAGDTLTTPGTGMSTQVADSTWELLYLGTVPLPPLNAQDGADFRAWKLAIEAKHPLGFSSTLDCCGVWLIPSTMEGEPQLLMEYVDEDGDTGTLDTAKWWTYDLARDGGQGVTLDGDILALTSSGTVTRNDDRTVAILPSDGRIQAPINGLDETQSWVAVRFRTNQTAAAMDNLASVFVWGDDTSNFLYLIFKQTTPRWEFGRVSVGTFDFKSIDDTWAAADTEKLLILKWTATTIALSIDGAAFDSVASTHIPTLTATTYDLGADGDNRTSGVPADIDVRWVMAGTGTLTDADAATLDALGNTTKPTPATLGSDAAVVFLWDAMTDIAATSGAASSRAQTVVGELAVGPGPATLVIMPEIGGGAVDVVDCAFAVGAELTPLYKLPPGT